jgi:hypothetical protein
MKVVLYIGGINGCWAERCPESPYMGEWETIPTFRTANGGRPDQTYVSVCLTTRNGGQDCLLYLLDKMIRDYDIDGIYVDGAGWAPNENMNLGFGYLDDRGKVRPTGMILETRELFKRVSALFLEHGKSPFIEHHCSWMLAGPVDSFTNVHLAGEYLAYRANESTTFPEEYMRIENSGIQWGIPVELLCYNTALWQRYIANCLVCGGSPMTTLSSFYGSALGEIQRLSPSWKAFAAFDLSGAEWIPYWKAGNLIQSENPAHKVSFYRHPKDGLLLLLANTSKEPGVAKVRLDLKGLGLAKQNAVVKVANKDEQTFEFKEGLLTVPLLADDFVIFRITAEP